MPSLREVVHHQLNAYLDFLHQYNFLAASEVRQLQDQRFLRSAAKVLIRKGELNRFWHRFTLVSLRTINGRATPFVLAENRRIQVNSGVLAFVGHRFSKSVTGSFRHNLQLVFKPYKVTPKYADTDMPNGPLFGQILEHIKACDFCVFDDRETEVRPNVFIELGAAMALNRPHFYFSFPKKREVVLGRKRERIAAPSDLDGMLCIRYGRYEELFREFALWLPVFLMDRGLAALP